MCKERERGQMRGNPLTEGIATSSFTMEESMKAQVTEAKRETLAMGPLKTTCVCCLAGKRGYSTQSTNRRYHSSWLTTQ
jgi:hypothetical protein